MECKSWFQNNFDIIRNTHDDCVNFCGFFYSIEIICKTYSHHVSIVIFFIDNERKSFYKKCIRYNIYTFDLSIARDTSKAIKQI